MNDRDCEKCKHHTEKGCDSWNCEREQRMTRKEAIKILKDILEEATETDNAVCYVTAADADALKMAINSLEIDERYELEYEQAEPFMNKPCVAHQVCHEDKVKVLDEIKAEILDNAFSVVNPKNTYEYINVLNLDSIEKIFDKYKA